MKNLIICEKPSLAKNVCNGLALNGERFTNKAGFYESDNYLVTAVFGHLFSLYDVDDYTGTQGEAWSIEKLPFVPDEFKYKLKTDFKTKKTDSGIEKQYNLIKSLIHRNDVSALTNCGDADREGQIIIDIVLNEAGNTKPVSRLWLPEQTEETIAKEIKNMKSNDVYQNLANEGYARQYIDWLYGINFTRYATIKSQTLLRVGRVITPVVKVIYDRDREINKFVSKPYFQLNSNEQTNGLNIELQLKEKWNSNDDVEMLSELEKLNSNDSIVSTIETKEKIVQSPKLFSQSDLQNFLSKYFKYSPSETLALTQELYEKGFVSYPRTPTNYLATNELGKVKEIISVISNKHNVEISIKETKRIFDDSKIESHSAIIPTKKLPNLETLTEKQRICYTAIYNRFCAVFSTEEHKIAETIIQITNGEHTFDLKGSITLSKGFLNFDESTLKKNVKELPQVKKGDKINSNFKIVNKMTVPPKHWTVETLNNFLKNPFRKDSDTEDEVYKNLLKGLEIGTEATRSGIIDTCIKMKYISLTNSTYKIAELGSYLVETIDQLGIDFSVESTANLGADLRSVYNKEITTEELLARAEEQIKQVVNSDVAIKKRVVQVESLGKCPICNKEVIENKVAYTCQDRDCRFVIFKENNFVKKAGNKNLTKSNVKNLLKNGKVDIKGLTSKTGKKYNATILLEVGDKWVNLKPDFNN